MFNDRLSKSDCEQLVRQLAACSFPFQCAHGRPSVAPLLCAENVFKAQELKEDAPGSLAGRLASWQVKG